MQKTHYFCDMCKQEFKPQDLVPAFIMSKNIDLCTSCNKKFITAFCNMAEKAQEENKA